MKKIIVQPGGFPMTTKTITQLADMTEQVADVVAKIAGNTNVIVSGVQLTGGVNVISDGWMIIDGELIPFVGGLQNTYVRIVENIEQVQYLADTDNNGIGDFVDAYINKYATFTSVAQGNIPFADFVRYEDIITTVLKSGVIQINPSTLTATCISGDFTLAQTEVSSNGNPIDSIYQFYKIDFVEVEYEYDVLVNIVSNFNSQSIIAYYFKSVFAAVIDKSSNNIRLSIKSIDNTILSDSAAPLRLEITLIKKR